MLNNFKILTSNFLQGEVIFKFRNPYRLALKCVALFSLIYLLLFFTELLQGIPLFIRFSITLLMFAVIPGYVIFCWLSLKATKIPYDFLSILLVSFSLSFSYNFIFNIIIFIFKLSLKQSVIFQLLITNLLVLFLLMIKSFREKRIIRAFPFSPLFVLGVVATFTVFVYCYYYLPHGFFSGEFVTLRKLFENDAITMTNIGYMPNESTTYIFVPFFLLVSAISHICSVDVVVGVTMMWSLTAIVSMLSMVQISFLITKSRWPGIVIFGVYLVHIVFYLHSRSDIVMSIPPTPDRYGFSVGGLMPLALFHFLVHMRDEYSNKGLFVGLIYLIVEIAFVHAREALVILSVIILSLFMFLLNYRQEWKNIKKCITLVFICGGILFIYKIINTAYAPELSEFISSMKVSIGRELSETVKQYGILNAFFIWKGIGSDFTRNINAISGSIGMLFVFISLIFLFLYVLSVKDNKYKLLMPFVICSLSLVLLNGFARGIISYIIGSRFLFELDGVLIVASMIVYGDMVITFSDLSIEKLSKYTNNSECNTKGKVNSSPITVRLIEWLQIFFVGIARMFDLKFLIITGMLFLLALITKILSLYPPITILKVNQSVSYYYMSSFFTYIGLVSLFIGISKFINNVYLRVLSILFIACSMLLLFSHSVMYCIDGVLQRLLGLTQSRELFEYSILVFLAKFVYFLFVLIFIISIVRSVPNDTGFSWRWRKTHVGLGNIIIYSIFFIIGVAPWNNKTNNTLCRAQFFPFEYKYAPSNLGITKYHVLSLLTSIGYLNANNCGIIGRDKIKMFDKGIIDFIEDVPSHKVWLSTSSMPILLAFNQYSPVWTSSGRFVGDMVKNDDFRKHIGGSKTLSISKILEFPDLLAKIQKEYDIDYLLVEPYEYKASLDMFYHNKDIRNKWLIVYDDGRYLCLKNNETINH